jgi:hypothetical protein
MARLPPKLFDRILKIEFLTNVRDLELTPFCQRN